MKNKKIKIPTNTKKENADKSKVSHLIGQWLASVITDVQAKSNLT